MIASTQGSRLKLLTYMRRGIIVMAATYLSIAGVLGVEILLKNAQAAQTEHTNELIAEQNRTLQGELDRAKKVQSIDSPSGLEAVGRLQKAINKIAAEHNCSVVAFHASSEVVPYLSRFTKLATGNNWAQLETEIDLSGSAKDVIACLVALQDENIAYEYDRLNITRDKVDEVGDATVLGQATLRVLVKSSEVAS